MAAFVRSYTQAGLSKEAEAISLERQDDLQPDVLTIPVSQSTTDSVSGTRLLHIQPMLGKSANS